MARIPYPSRASELPPVQQGGVRTLNVERMLYYLPDNLREEMGRLGKSLLWRGMLNPVLRELALVRVGRISGSAYEVYHHEALARAVGISEIQLDHVRRGDYSVGFTPQERAVLEFTDDVARNVRPNDKALAELQKYMSNGEIMELILAFGFYMTLCRILETFGPDLDDFVLEAKVR